MRLDDERALFADELQNDATGDSMVPGMHIPQHVRPIKDGVDISKAGSRELWHNLKVKA